jgi:hypothetical protein
LPSCRRTWRGNDGSRECRPTGAEMTLDIFDLLILVGDMPPPRDPNDDDDDDEDDEDEADDNLEPAVIREPAEDE